MATKTKKPTTTTKKPAAKKTAVVKAHRGMAHVPRGRQRPTPTPRPTRERPSRNLTRNRILSGSRLQVEPRRLGDDRPRGRNTQLPANFFQMSPNARKQFFAVRAAKDARGRQMTPAQRKAIDALRRRQREALNREALKPSDRPVLPLQRRPTVEQLRNAKRRRRPVGDPKARTPQKKRPTGTPRVPQAQPTPRAPTPRRRNFRFRGRRT